MKRIAGSNSRVFASLAMSSACALGLLLPAGVNADDPPFLRGDANADGKVSVSDIVMLRRFIFEDAALSPSCFDSGDADDNGKIEFMDAVMVLRSLFLGGEFVSSPFPEVGGDPTPDDGLPCSSYEVQAAPNTDDLIRFGDITASPGEEVKIPVYLTNSVEVEAIQLVVNYDPTVFIPNETIYGFDFTGTHWERCLSLPIGPEGGCIMFRRVRLYPDEGFFTVGLIGSLNGRFNEHAYTPIPPGNDVLLVKIGGKILTRAQPNSSVLLEPTNGPDGKGVLPPLFLKNELTYKGDARYVSIVPRTIAGRINIVEDITLFSRGDSNGDRAVDIADPIHLLGYLFLAGPEPSCMDSADADDNGRLDLNDPVVILNQLFLATSAIAAPYPAPGKDLTSDSFPPCQN